MTFNINCKNCDFCRRGVYDDTYYCVHPKAMFYSGRPILIIDIEQNIDCDWYYRELGDLSKIDPNYL